MDKYPAGLWAKTECFRVIFSVWTDECKEFVLKRMKASANNIKPVLVIDEDTFNIYCNIPNSDLDGFDVLYVGTTDDIKLKMLCQKVKSTGQYQVMKTYVQNSSLGIEEKETTCKLIFKKYCKHTKLSSDEEEELKTSVKKFATTIQQNFWFKTFKK